MRMVFHADAAVPLRETALSRDQRLTELEDGRLCVEAIVPDTVELRTWLRGFGPLVEVLGPASLRREFRELAGALAATYAKPSRLLGQRLAKAKAAGGRAEARLAKTMGRG